MSPLKLLVSTQALEATPAPGYLRFHGSMGGCWNIKGAEMR